MHALVHLPKAFVVARSNMSVVRILNAGLLERERTGGQYEENHSKSEKVDNLSLVGDAHVNFWRHVSWGAYPAVFVRT